jgi:hypothetical protein
MIKRLSVLLAVGFGLSLVLAACDRPAGGRNSDGRDLGGKDSGSKNAGGKDPYTRLIDHTDNMIRILKDNKEDPDKAMKELTAYQASNNAEVQKLKQDVADLMQKDAMKVAAASAVYGLKSAELDTLATELTARAKAQASAQ